MNKIMPGAQPEVDSPARPVNGSVEVAPLAPDFDVGLVDPPRRTHRRAEPSPPLLERGHVTWTCFGKVESCFKSDGLPLVSGGADEIQ
jgi:hypothetical protein